MWQKLITVWLRGIPDDELEQLVNILRQLVRIYDEQGAKGFREAIEQYARGLKK